MARVLLVVPPSLPGTTSNPEGSSGLGALEPVAQGFRYPPHTVATLTATLRRAGQEVLVLDAPALEDTLNGCLAALQAAHPDLIGVFVSWATREADQRFLAALRALGLAVPVVAFGVSVRSFRRSNVHSRLRQVPGPV